MTAHILEFQPRDCKSYDFETMAYLSQNVTSNWHNVKGVPVDNEMFLRIVRLIVLSTTFAKPERKRHEEIFHCYVSLVKWSPGIIYAVVWNVDRNNGVGNSDIDDH